MSELYRQLPKVDVILADPRVEALPRGVAVGMARVVLDELRAAIGSGQLKAMPDVAERVAARGRALLAGRMVPVINATGVVVHTNLGRSPWHPDALAAATRVASGYCNLEMRLETGARGGRLEGVAALLAHLCGADDAIVVNNCAAAVLLALTALARGREVVVSRGELVEIGGSFRVPDVVASGGAQLVEVGTTNRTRVADYVDATGPGTAVYLQVHRSNFRIEGFTETPGIEALARAGTEHGVIVVHDLGSGCLAARWGEQTVGDSLAAGADLVLFSGDKMLGGPQAGLIVGRAEVVQRLRKHPLYRALRVGKTTLAAVEATLAVHASGRATPVDTMLDATPESLRDRADGVVQALRAAGVTGTVRDAIGYVGGGAVPMQALPTAVVAIAHPHPNALAERLRTGSPALVPRVSDDALLLDLRTVTPQEEPALVDVVAQAISKV